MFIRRTITNSKKSEQVYYTYRLVEGVRLGSVVKQTTLLNLGSHFDIVQTDWALLASRIDALLRGQADLQLQSVPEAVEVMAQRCAAQLIARLPTPNTQQSKATGTQEPDRFQEVDVDSIEMVRPRSVGVEHAALSAIQASGLQDKLTELGLNRPQIAAALGNIIGRMAHPGSELSTHAWLQRRSGLGELIDFDFESMDLNRLYRSSDALYKHRDAVQEHLFGAAQSAFGFCESVTLYDLTNTYFEGVAAGAPKAARGRSKEKRSDCPLVTLAMVLDGSGFVRKSQVFAGNVSEPKTLKDMLTQLSAPIGAAVVMDAGIATDANLSWLRQEGYHYVVVSRQRSRQFDEAQSVEVKTAGDVTIKIQRVMDANKAEAHLYCHSPDRELKERAMDDAKSRAFIAALQKIIDALAKPGIGKSVAKVMERIGRAKQRYSRAAQHYLVNAVADEDGVNVTAITWEKHTKEGSAAMLPGVYCLRTTLIDLDDATLWRTYSMLTQLESVFRSLKTDLGLRPVYHQIERRIEGHLFISVLAYHFVHTIRLQLKAQGISESWQTLRETLNSQQRITTTLTRRDGRAVHVRKATRPEPHQQRINEILGLSANPGGTHRAVI
ncbi:MAG: IS1634 family transposase [Burkholderiales bacterium]